MLRGYFELGTVEHFFGVRSHEIDMIDSASYVKPELGKNGSVWCSLQVDHFPLKYVPYLLERINVGNAGLESLAHWDGEIMLNVNMTCHDL